jgi:hypothetical protein
VVDPELLPDRPGLPEVVLLPVALLPVPEVLPVAPTLEPPLEPPLPPMPVLACVELPDDFWPD